MEQTDDYEPILDDDGNPTGYFRHKPTGEICTLWDEYDADIQPAERGEG